MSYSKAVITTASNQARQNAFTLIELLIVVLIIAILAAIAIPNFMEFQTRAKISRVKNDYRTLATGLEAYSVDEGTYPARNLYLVGTNHYFDRGLQSLTTPIAYLATLPADPFGDIEYSDRKIIEHYEFGSGKAGVHASYGNNFPNDIWMLESAGPDNYEETHGSVPFYTTNFPWVGTEPSEANIRTLVALFYDPSNGTASRGQLFRVGGAPPPELAIKLFYDLATR